MNQRVVFAYAERLDAAVAIPCLSELTGADVVAVAVDTGRCGDPDALRRSALRDGAIAAEVVDAREEYASAYRLAAVRANAVRADHRALIAGHLVAAAERHGATAVAHAATGEDGRARFAAAIAALAPHLTVVAPTGAAPVRRAERIAARAWDGGLAADPDEVAVTFEAGVPVALDGETRTAYEIVTDLDYRAGAQGVGRVGTAEHVLVAVHRELEEAVLDPDLLLFKRSVDRRWAELVDEGRWFSPLRGALESFIGDTRHRVTGEVRVILHAGRVTVTACRPEGAAYAGRGAYGGPARFERGSARAA